jgi:hypothetical protein
MLGITNKFIIMAAGYAVGLVVSIATTFGLVYLILNGAYDENPGFCYEKGRFLKNMELLDMAVKNNIHILDPKHEKMFDAITLYLLNENKNCCEIECLGQNRKIISLEEVNLCKVTLVYIYAKKYRIYTTLDACGRVIDSRNIEEG